MASSSTSEPVQAAAVPAAAERLLLSTRYRSSFAVAWADLKQGWELHRLWLRLGYAEVRRRYRRTLLGPFWATGQIAIYILCVGYIFSSVLEADRSTYISYLTTGFITWMLVYAVLTEATAAFVSNAAIRQQQPFPYSMFIYAMLARNFFAHLHHYVLYFAVSLIFGLQISWNLLLLVPGYLLTGINLAWLSLILATLTARFRDIQQLIVSLMQVMLFVTPIFYSQDMLSPTQRVFVLMPNLIYHMTVIIRAPLLGIAPPISSYAILILSATFGWLFAAWLFGKCRQTIIFWIM